MTIHMYGIANCDTIKKGKKWLLEHKIDYVFHDYKKEGVDKDVLCAWSQQVGWEVLLNKRGTTWRKLPDTDKESVDEGKALRLLAEHTSMIKRPVLVAGEHVLVGFSETSYKSLLL
ncbi:MAG: ArsC family reductase [Mariprofundaceae bacterium]|nr:ArsC family reductase [Mariprofundaceae bacterium]